MGRYISSIDSVPPGSYSVTKNNDNDEKSEQAKVLIALGLTQWTYYY
jgi:hypothetical protein